MIHSDLLKALDYANHALKMSLEIIENLRAENDRLRAAHDTHRVFNQTIKEPFIEASITGSLRNLPSFTNRSETSNQCGKSYRPQCLADII
jgi:hypothetical protein